MICKTSWKLPLIAIAALAVAGCGGASGGNGSTDPIAELLFSPTTGAVPGPNDLGFTGSEDGTLNVTEVTPTGDSEPLDSQVSVNSTDGFSTLASASASFTVPVDGGTVVPGDTVRVFAVTTLTDPNGTTSPGPAAVTGLDTAAPYPTGELAVGTQYTASLSSADRNGRTLAITPLQPLQPDQTFMVVVTNGIQEEGGGPISASEEYELVKGSDPLFDGTNSLVEGFDDDEAKTLEGVRQLTQTHLAVAGGVGIAPEDIIASWTFTTQTVNSALPSVQAIINSASPVFVDAGGVLNQLTDTGEDTPGGGAGSIYAGVLAGVPYYLEGNASNPADILTGFWKQADGSILTPGSSTPVPNATLNIPVLVTVPNDDGGNPSEVVIFQHGITGNRTNMLGIANALNAANHTVVAIDLPLHGITDTANPLYSAGLERTFDVDLVDNETGDAGSDGAIDPSGEHFINLSSLQTSRDNIRQAVADLFAVTRAVRVAAGLDLDGDSDADLTNNISFVGHSLGGIVGTPYLANEAGLDAAVLGMAGGGIAKLLDGSPSIGPELAAGLAENNLIKGLSGYEQFLGAAQTVIDTAEPLNHAVAAAGNHNTLLLEVIGGNSSPPDQVVPNNVLIPFDQGIPDNTVPSPTAGTDPLAAVMGATQINANPPGAGDYLIRYTAGDHSSLLSPDASAAATTEMQTNVANFVATDGAAVVFSGSGTVAAP